MDKIDGLFPVIAMSKNKSKSPRSYRNHYRNLRFLTFVVRLRCRCLQLQYMGEMEHYSDEQNQLILEDFNGKRINILAPVIRSQRTLS